MTYLALYREWRPRTFAEVVGQDHVVRTLSNALKTQRLSHAYLFCGPRGTGKTSVAKILARAVNCRRPQGVDPCGQCDSCREIEAGTSMDVSEIDAASNRGIDEVRDLREKVRFAPSSGKARVFIVDEVHMLTNEAFNALLKTLEEPPAHAIFMLATTEPHRVPLTILSRCQRFDFHRIGDREMTGRLMMVARASGISIDPAALDLVVKASDGAVRDGLSILDQAAAYSGNHIGVDEIHGILGTVREDLLEKASRGLMEGRAGDVLGLVAGVADQGKDLRIFLKELNSRLRRTLLDALGSAGAEGEEIDRLTLAIHRLAATEQEMRWSTQPRVLLEVALVRASRILAAGAGGTDRVGELAARLREVEGQVARLARGAQAGSASAAASRGGNRADAPQDQESGLGAGQSGTVTPALPRPGSVREKNPPAFSTDTGRVDDSSDGKKAPGDRPGGISPPGGGKVAVEKEVPVAYNVRSHPAVPGGMPAAGPGFPPAGRAGDPGMPDLLKKIKSRWNDIMEVARKVCPHIASHLAQGKGWPMDLEGNTLTIGFPREETYSPLAVGILESEANLREISGLIKSVCQADLRIRLVTSDRKPPGGGRQRKKAVQPGDVDSLFGKDEEIPADAFEVFDT